VENRALAITKLVFTTAGGFIALISFGCKKTRTPGRPAATSSTPHLA